MGLGLNKNPNYHQGFYKPIHDEKYVGKELPIYRSGLELKFCQFCDKNDKVLKWASEPFSIPYYDTIKCKNRQYYIDFVVSIKEGEVLKNYLVEVKPYKQTLEPNTKNRKKRSALLYEKIMWENNANCKWPAAREFAKNHGMEFIIITDKDLA